MSALSNLLQNFHDGSTHDKGTLFEILCLYFLRHDKFYKSEFSEVCLWKDWPLNENKPDTGIDIVAKIRNSETFCAVQCKYRSEGVSINKSEIDSFLALSSKEIFSRRIIISTFDNFDGHAEDALKNQNPKVTRLTLENLEACSIDWSEFNFNDLNKVRYIRKEIRDHQREAIEKVLENFKSHDRGKLIMACGTGKTFTSLKISEQFSGAGGIILVLVPSISLLNQSVIAWHSDAELKMISFAVCSDVTAGKKDYPDEDMKLSDLLISPTTKPEDLISAWENISDETKSNSMTVIFSTYQSLQVINQAQKLGFPKFNLVICDEAHRTAGEADSKFRLIHDDNFISAEKRLYMTATPKIFAETLKKKATDNNRTLCSMDDEKIFGHEFFRLSFSQAVNKNLLSDYKVMIFMTASENEGFIPITSEKNVLLSDAAKIAGCRKALAKELNLDDYELMQVDPSPMKSAVAFTSTIKNSKEFAEIFKDVVNNSSEDFSVDIECEVKHIDGTFSVSKRNQRLSWLRQNENKKCKILSNARCLSEGVDVPALDAVIFLDPKKSEIDIVQSVGRVMRKAPGKNFGYVIIPIAVRSDVEPEEALDNNKEYKAVWDVLRALRSHDDNFNVIINSLDLNKHSDKIIVVPPKIKGMSRQLEIQFLQDWEKALSAKIVQKCGDREYWDKWVKDLADVADKNSTKLKNLIHSDNKNVKNNFDCFLDGLHKNVNPRISEDEAIDMLSQHIISKPVFDELFSDFSHKNPMSILMQGILEILGKYDINTNSKELENFYGYVHEAVKEAKTDLAKQTLIRRIYENFFKIAFKKTASKLGIVYTPLEVVDFILKSADWAVKNELGFSEGLSSDDVQILDPFSGTGTFIVRLIQLGLISPDVLKEKYSRQIYANEILLLAYYISAINIEAAFSQQNNQNYVPFPGMVLTDTFDLNKISDRTPDMFMFYDNGRRAFEETRAKVNVIIGNPPYSVGQKSANDNNQNEKYDELDALITQDYAETSTATNKNSLYDSYIRAIKWATERIKASEKSGIICYVTNGSFIDSNSTDGMRKSLAKDFTSIYIFNLKGNQYTMGEQSRREGGKIFGEGSRLPIVITLFVRDLKKTGEDCKIYYYYEVNDYMNRKEKLRELLERESFGEMMSKNLMIKLTPNRHGDWINQRGEIFETFINLGNKKEKDRFAIFDERYSRGLETGRDSWCYNFSHEALKYNMKSMINVYNEESEKWQNYHDEKTIEDFVTKDENKIKWTGLLYKRAEAGEKFSFEEGEIRVSLYRPYEKEQAYFSQIFNHRTSQLYSIFPKYETKNLVICVPGKGNKKNFSVLMTDILPSLSVVDASQCFPLYWYEVEELQSPEPIRHDAISDEALKKFRENYNDNAITKEDIFYYIYGVLSSPEYSERFGNDVKRTLARVPLAKNFHEFSKAGRKLAELHVNYENVEAWPLEKIGDESNLRVEKMRLVTSNGEKTIRYNENLTLKNIPSEAWEYIVNGRSAIEWLIDRYKDDTDKDSGLRNDCNAWGIEHNDPEYILNLISRVVRVSVETVKICKGLPELGVF